MTAHAGLLGTFLEEVASKTKFIPYLGWVGFAYDMIKECLSNPIQAGEVSTYEESISSVGKKKILYTKANAEETVTAELNACPANKEASATISRSGFGASSTFTYYSTEGTNVKVAWGSSYYTLSFTAATASGSSRGLDISMYAYSVNSLPTDSTTSLTMLSDTDYHFLGSSSAAKYAENTFCTNSYNYNGNHTLIYSGGNYWNTCTILSPIMAGTTINKNNYNDYAMYGYYINNNGDLDIDLDVLAAYISAELEPWLELQYKNAYQKFPDIDADITDEDINYFNPFEDDEDDSGGGNLPDTTAPGGGGGGGMTPAELEGVLNGESYYILDMETDFPGVVVGTLPDVENFSLEIVSASTGITEFVIQLFSSLGILPLFVTLSVLAFIVFVLRG